MILKFGRLGCLLQSWYNSSHHSALGCSPFKALYGCQPNLGAPLQSTEDTIQSVTVVIENREAHLTMLTQRLEHAQNRMKVQADKNRIDKKFAVGERVLLKLQPYTQTSVANRPFLKLAYKFFGPYKILEWVGAVAYRLELLDHSEIHPVFHVSQLKPFTPDYTLVFSTLLVLTDLQASEAVLEHIF